MRMVLLKVIAWGQLMVLGYFADTDACLKWAYRVQEAPHPVVFVSCEPKILPPVKPIIEE